MARSWWLDQLQTKGFINLTGFSVGNTTSFADVNLHVDDDNYGIIMDVHQSLMHILAQ